MPRGQQRPAGAGSATDALRQQMAQRNEQDEAGEDTTPEVPQAQAELQDVYQTVHALDEGRPLGSQQASGRGKGRGRDDYDTPRKKSRRGPTQGEQDEFQATEVARLLRREEDQYFAERREEMVRAQRRGEPLPPKRNRVLSLIVEAPDASVPHYSDGTPVQKEKGYVYRWVRTISDFGNQESNSRIIHFQANRYEKVPDHTRGGEPLRSQFGVLMRAKAEHAGIHMVSRMRPGALRRKDEIRVPEEMVEEINSEAGTEVIRITKERDHRKSDEVIYGDRPYEPENYRRPRGHRDDDDE